MMNFPCIHGIPMSRDCPDCTKAAPQDGGQGDEVRLVARLEDDARRQNSAYDRFGMNNTAQSVDPLAYKVAMDCKDLRATVARLEGEKKRLNDWVNDLQSGMFINCVYCGHRYGPDPGTPIAMAEVLKRHIEVCPQHPLSAMKTAWEIETKTTRDLTEKVIPNIRAEKNLAVAMLESAEKECRELRGSLEELVPILQRQLDEHMRVVPEDQYEAVKNSNAWRTAQGRLDRANAALSSTPSDAEGGEGKDEAL